MKKFAKVALAAVMLAGATAVASSPAEARVVVGFGVGGPGYYGYGGPAYGPSYTCDPYSRWYDPYRCDAYAPGYYGGYYGPGYYPWYHGYWRGGYYRSGYYGHGYYGHGGYGNGGHHH